MTDLYRPLRSLERGNWFKLICGASFQHLPAVRNLTLVYALAGVDCVDVAADPAVIVAAREALQVAASLKEIACIQGFSNYSQPWLMVSLNDGEDPHFRKASFNPQHCPEGCSRPCETICPADAIVFQQADDGFSGVIDDHCYGCGRCLPVCPIQHIETRSYVSTPAAIAPLVLQGVDAVEIHTQVGRLFDFERLWRAIAPFLPHLKLIAVSCPDGEDLIDYLRSIYDLIAPLPCPIIWQTDGRPMSGDIGDGATRAAVKLGQKVLAAKLPGYVQLAGGTNDYTVSKLKELGLFRGVGSRHEENTISDKNSSLTESHGQVASHVAGIGYGSYARVLLAPILNQLESMSVYQRSHSSTKAADSLYGTQRDPAQILDSHSHPAATLARLEASSDLLWQAVGLADSLVSQLKSPMKQQQSIRS